MTPETPMTAPEQRVDLDPRYRQSFPPEPHWPKYGNLILVCVRCGAHRTKAFSHNAPGGNRACGNCGGNTWEERFR